MFKGIASHNPLAGGTQHQRMIRGNVIINRQADKQIKHQQTKGGGGGGVKVYPSD